MDLVSGVERPKRLIPTPPTPRLAPRSAAQPLPSQLKRSGSETSGEEMFLSARETLDLSSGERSIKNHEIIEETHIVDPEPQGGFLSVPIERFGEGCRIPHKSPIDEKGGFALRRAEAFVGDRYVGPLFRGKWRFANNHKPVFKCGFLIGSEV